MNKVCLKNCFVRFEPDINSGTMFLFCKENGKLLEGDYYSYVVIKSIMDNVILDDLIQDISYENNINKNDVEYNIKTIIDKLVSKGIANYEE
jgi:hypothetical protein